MKLARQNVLKRCPRCKIRKPRKSFVGASPVALCDDCRMFNVGTKKCVRCRSHIPSEQIISNVCPECRKKVGVGIRIQTTRTIDSLPHFRVIKIHYGYPNHWYHRERVGYMPCWGWPE